MKNRVLALIRLLTVMREPFTFCHFHIGKCGFEGRSLGAAGIDAKGYLTAALVKMADSHLGEFFAVRRAFNTVVVLPAAEAIPHLFDARGDLCCCPVGIAAVGNNAAKMLKFLVFIFDRALQPVLAVKVENNAALVKSVTAFEGGFYGK